ncbi:MAG TPA: hypothetical protein VHE34_22395 [Puia sp.]|uniref:hypothetical protein n=1 Tax=Puia sp. TaxID=2045100 RepID=UPI002B5A0420|nr:hypothetical protein [Puia sp.]HVU97998.1 hypothetical protein [Puia sp.]
MRRLGRFLRRVRGDVRMGPLHICLYVVLLDACKGGSRPDLFVIDRDEVMEKAKIGSPGTYYRLMRDLSEGGYITYRSKCGPKGMMVGIVGK